MKKVLIALIIVAALIVVLIGKWHFTNGFFEVQTIGLSDYITSDDGNKIEIKVLNYCSMGFVRNVNVKRKEDKMYVSFYQTFGPLNSDWGAKDTFMLEVDDDCNEIYFLTTNDEYKLVLKRNDAVKCFPKGTLRETVEKENASWIRVKKQNN